MSKPADISNQATVIAKRNFNLRIPILFGSNGQGYTEKDWPAPTADYGQRFLVRVRISELASFRTCVSACLFSGFQSHRTIVAATEGRLVL
jgi:hypothetical protein